MSAKQALEGTRLNAFGMNPDDLVVVAWDTEDGPEHPLYDERAQLPVDEALVIDIMAQGVLEAVLVRKNGDEVEVVAGRQRVKCAREANKRLKKEGRDLVRVPCMVRKGDDGQMLGVSIAENELRQSDPLTVKAQKLVRYLGAGRSEKEAAVRFGVSLQTITNWGRMGDLDKVVVKAIEEKKVPASAGYGLAALSREEQRVELEKLLGNGRAVTVRGARHATKTVKAQKRGEQTDFEPPGKRVINKVLRLNEKASVLNGDFLKGVKWVLGDIGPTSIGGLSELIREASGKKE